MDTTFQSHIMIFHFALASRITDPKKNWANKQNKTKGETSILHNSPAATTAKYPNIILVYVVIFTTNGNGND